MGGAKPHAVSLQQALFNFDSDRSIVPRVHSVVCTLIKCLLSEIAIVALMASSLSDQARVSTAHLRSIQHMESRQETQCGLHLCLISVVFPPESQPHTYPTGGTPSVSAAASLIQTQRGPKHFFLLEITQNLPEHFATYLFTFN